MHMILLCWHVANSLLTFKAVSMTMVQPYDCLNASEVTPEDDSDVQF